MCTGVSAIHSLAFLHISLVLCLSTLSSSLLSLSLLLLLFSGNLLDQCVAATATFIIAVHCLTMNLAGKLLLYLEEKK